MTIRAASMNDVAEIHATEEASRADGWSLSAIHSSLSEPHTFCLIAQDDGQTAGHVLGTSVVDEAEILTIAVRPTHRRRGIARSLLTSCYDTWRARGITSAFLEVRESNTGARLLYDTTGWEVVGRRTGYYRDGETAILMRWSS